MKTPTSIIASTLLSFGMLSYSRDTTAEYRANYIPAGGYKSTGWHGV